MDVYAIHAGGSEELLLSGAGPAEVNDIKEWFSYTKPLGADLRIVVRKASKVVDSLLCAGAEAASFDRDRQPFLAA